MSAEDLKRLHRINKIMIHIIIRYWFESAMTADAAINQLEQYQVLLAYRKVDRELADVCIAKVQKHLYLYLYYTAEEIIVLGLVSKKVSAAEKADMAKKLLEQPAD
jgi:hypothetical protein